MHDIDADRLEPPGWPPSAGRPPGTTAVVPAVARPPARAGRRRLRRQHGEVGGIAATVTDFEVPARFGLRQTIADTLGVGGVFRALRTFPLLDGLAADMRSQSAPAPGC